MQNILVTGGAGYVGSALVPVLLERGYKVTVYDSLMYGGDQLLPYIRNPNFKMIQGDILDTDKLSKATVDKDAVIHLAAIVGYGACRKDEKRTYEVNTTGTKLLMEKCMNPDQLLVFASTGSNYGSVDGVCTESTPLHPLSIYGKSKTMAEEAVLKRDNVIAYRFATIFGVSSRMRLDLLINDLAYKAYTEKYIAVYEAHFMRTFLHISDMVSSFVRALTNTEVLRNTVYNIGDESMNFSKRHVCETIKRMIPGTIVHYVDFAEDVDKRDYVVSYEKAKDTGFRSTVTLEQGIEELLKSYPCLVMNSRYRN